MQSAAKRKSSLALGVFVIAILFTVETVSCLGACGLAPALVVDDKVHGQVTPAEAVDIVEAILAEEKA